MLRTIPLAIVFLLGCRTPAADVSTPISPLGGVEDPPDHETQADTDTDTDTTPSTPAPTLAMGSTERSCSHGDYLDLDLQIPEGAVVQTFLKLDDHYGQVWWTDFQEGTVILTPEGADLYCGWTVQDDIPQDVDPEWIAGVRVVWVAPQ